VPIFANNDTFLEVSAGAARQPLFSVILSWSIYLIRQESHSVYRESGK